MWWPTYKIGLRWLLESCVVAQGRGAKESHEHHLATTFVTCKLDARPLTFKAWWKQVLSFCNWAVSFLTLPIRPDGTTLATCNNCVNECISHQMDVGCAPHGPRLFGHIVFFANNYGLVQLRYFLNNLIWVVGDRCLLMSMKLFIT